MCVVGPHHECGCPCTCTYVSYLLLLIHSWRSWTEGWACATLLPPIPSIQHPWDLRVEPGLGQGQLNRTRWRPVPNTGSVQSLLPPCNSTVSQHFNSGKRFNNITMSHSDSDSIEEIVGLKIFQSHFHFYKFSERTLSSSLVCCFNRTCLIWWNLKRQNTSGN